MKAVSIMLHYSPHWKEEKKVNEEDFKEKCYFQWKGTNVTFIKEYSPKIFLKLREMNSIDQRSFIKSICESDLIPLGKNLGKSGSFLYSSNDSKYILKTISKSEKDIILSFLKPYFYFFEKNSNSFIVKILSLFRIVDENLQDVHVIIMENVFPSISSPHELYDLKGSTIGRTYKPSNENETIIYKDLDLKRKIKIKPGLNKKVIQQLMLDSVFLEEMGIIDYSLLLGIYYEKKKEKEEKKDFSFHTFKYIIENAFIDQGNYVPSFSTLLQQAQEKDDTICEFFQLNQKEILEYLKNPIHAKENLLNMYKPSEKIFQKEKRFPIRRDSELLLKSGSVHGMVKKLNGKVDLLDHSLVKSNIDQLKKREKEIRKTYFVDKEQLLEDTGHSEQSNLLQKLFKKKLDHQIIEFNLDDDLPKITHSLKENKGKHQGYEGVGFSKLKETFHFGIIDITQRYNIKKKTGLFLSGLVYDKNELSSIDSKKYGERFRLFIQSMLE
jgi:hypothetical protein